MRDLQELRIRSKKSDRVYTPQDFERLEEFFGAPLPLSYRQFLSSHNGGYAEVNSFTSASGEYETAIDHFLSVPENDDDEMWYYTENLKEDLKRPLVVIGMNGGGNAIFIDLSVGRGEICLYFLSNGLTIKIADDFENFLDKLYVNPELP